MSSALQNIVLSCLLILSFHALGQEEKVDERWNQLEERINYGPSGDKKGPNNKYANPPSLQKEPSNHSAGRTIKNAPSNDEIIYSREQLYDQSEGGGVKRKIKEPSKSDLDDIDAPDTDIPTIDPPGWETERFNESSGTFWKVLLIILGIVILAFLIYYLFFKNAENTDAKIAPVDYSSNDIDPSKINKSQLEIDLEQAIQKEDFRTAIRIYYTMILKALIEKKWILWEKKKTNINYVLEMQKRSEKHEFETTVRIFEWVWYGKHQPKSSEFKQVQYFFESFYKKIKGE